MNTFKNTIKHSVIGGVTFLITVGFGLVSYGYVSTLGGKTAGNPLTVTDWNSMVANIDEVKANSITPTGVVVAYNGTACPSGWLEASGSNVPVGIGGSSTLNLRGEFIRGLDNGRGVDIGRTFGSPQGDTFKLHTHTMTNAATKTGYDDYIDYGSSTASANDAGYHDIQTAAAGAGSETRPRNVALLYCMKQ